MAQDIKKRKLGEVSACYLWSLPVLVCSVAAEPGGIVPTFQKYLFWPSLFTPDSSQYSFNYVNREISDVQ